MRIVKELVEIWPNEVCNSLSSRSGVEMEVSPYIHPPFKIAMSRSNGLGMKNIIELCTSDMSWSSGVFAMELHYEFWCRNFGSGLPGIVFTAVSLLLNEVLESSPMPMTVEYFLYSSLCGWGSKGIWSRDKSDNKWKYNNPQDISQLCTKQVGTGEIIK